MDDNVRGTQGMDEISGSRPRPRATGVRNGGGGGAFMTAINFFVVVLTTNRSREIVLIIRGA